jgi:hypothetical protein
MRRSHLALVLATAAACAACNYNKGSIVGSIEYVDSSWDPSADPGAVPGVLIHVMSGDVMRGREILDGFEPVVAAGIPGERLPTLVEYVQTYHAVEGEKLDAVQVDQQGHFSFERLPRGSYLVLADYTSDLGYFAWLKYVEVQGTRETIVDLSFDNRLPIVMPLRVAPAKKPPPELSEFEPEPPPGSIDVEVPADDSQVIEKLEKLGGQAITP